MDSNQFGVLYDVNKRFFFFYNEDGYCVNVPRVYNKQLLDTSFVNVVDDILFNKIFLASKKVRYSYDRDIYGETLRVDWKIRVDRSYKRRSMLLNPMHKIEFIDVLEYLCHPPEFYEQILNDFQPDYLGWEGKKIPSVRENRSWCQLDKMKAMIDFRKVKKPMTQLDINYIASSKDFDYMFDYIKFTKADEELLKIALNKK